MFKPTLKVPITRGSCEDVRLKAVMEGCRANSMVCSYINFQTEERYQYSFRVILPFLKDANSIFKQIGSALESELKALKNVTMSSKTMQMRTVGLTKIFWLTYKFSDDVILNVTVTRIDSGKPADVDIIYRKG